MTFKLNFENHGKSCFIFCRRHAGFGESLLNISPTLSGTSRRTPSPVGLRDQVGLVDVFVLHLLVLVVLLGGRRRRGGLPGAGGGAADVLSAVELIDAAGQQHAVAVQHHGAFGAGLAGDRKWLRETQD